MNRSLNMHCYYRIVFAVGTSEVCSGARILKRTLRIAHKFSQEETVLHGF